MNRTALEIRGFFGYGVRNVNKRIELLLERDMVLIIRRMIGG